jgi:hypothetical protein
VEGPEHRGPKPCVDARDCNDPSRTSAIASDVLLTTHFKGTDHDDTWVRSYSDSADWAAGLLGPRVDIDNWAVRAARNAYFLLVNSRIAGANLCQLLNNPVPCLALVTMR